VLDLQAGGAERLRHHRDHPEGDRDAQCGADRRRPEVVRQPLEDEHLHEVLAPGSDRARDPQLRATLGGEGHEDQEDQQHPGDDREAAERREDRDEDVTRLVGALQVLLLDLLELEAQGGQRRASGMRDRIGQLGSRRLVAIVRNEHLAYLARAAQQRLGTRERQEHRRPVGSRPVELHDRRDPNLRLAGAGEHLGAIPGARVELVSGIAVEVDLAVAELCERDGGARGFADVAEAGHPRRIGREQRHARFGLAARQVLQGDRLDDRRRDAVDQAGATQRAFDPRHVALVEVRDARGLPGRQHGRQLGATCRHQLIGLAERLDHRGPDRAAIVSPVTSADEMIVVPSINPVTISSARPRRRETLRSPSLSSTRLRIASVATAATTRPRASARVTATPPIGIPKSRCTADP
jgi:hypothetical protein